MRKIIDTISDKLNYVVSLVACALLAVILVCCTLQVVTRYVFNSSLYWSEEVARYIFVWCSMLGLSVAVKNGSNASIDVISGRLKGKAKSIQKIVVDVIIMAICVLLIRYGIQILPTMARTVSAALLIPNNYLYASVPVSAAIIVIHCLSNLCDSVAELSGKSVDEKEE